MVLLSQLLDPAALAIVGGGTLLSAVLRSPLRDLRRALAALRTLARAPFSAEPALAQIAALARIARRSGVLSLDRSVIADPDIAAAIAGIVDGDKPDAIAALVAWRRRARCERHAAAADVWAGAAEAAPAMGMVGTLVGLAAMFAAMRDPATIGGAMAIALLSTLYGALFGNLVFLPIANRLRASARHEGLERARIEAPLVALAAREAPGVALASAA
ncbi:MotA/TolQ/ExbB proton channel family protein [Sphingomonas sp. CROZ-RG-20F-R02-07]|uniref:motility protein A n=1 Tax=Sphingomonas sp. CROZ-RG-20F-R02-07 TaxID=2914832 RepID=UPI001F587BA4|nr:MotA/TolQ/ExbB proton channel family protein [Sphingomonas sp. CROZ-RG-20F-R02-07]